MSRISRWSTIVLSLTLARAVPALGQFTINPTFDASITSDAHSSLIQDVINHTITGYESLFSDHISVNILFRYAGTAPNGTALAAGTLARSNYVVFAPVWANFRNALILDATTANDASAIASLPASPLARDIEYSSADGRAVGLAAAGTMNATGAVGSGTFDGIVTLNSNKPFDFNRSDGIGVGEFDAVRMFEHEIDEVLGLGSILPAVNDFRGGTAYRPEDLFRYSDAGVRSLSAGGAAASYFSIDGGVTDLVGFNQNGGGDYGDWLSPACATPHPHYVQYAFTCAGGKANISPTSPEGVALDVVGYNLNENPTITTPEPGTLTLIGMGLLGLAARKRRARR